MAENDAIEGVVHKGVVENTNSILC